MNSSLYKYILGVADNCLILGQRLGELCGHGPSLETDIACTNISLDLFGQVRSYYQYAAKVAGDKRTEDDIAMMRPEREYVNVLLVEQPNTDFAFTIVRQFLFDVYHYLFLNELQKSKDETLHAIARKSSKEVSYHLRFSSDWIKRLGDGTEESHSRMQQALEDKIHYFEELFIPTETETRLLKIGIAPDLSLIREKAYAKLNAVLQESTLSIPEDMYPQQGGRSGNHTEYLGFILAELQYMQKSYPNLTW